jgi:hypothetical protein
MSGSLTPNDENTRLWGRMISCAPVGNRRSSAWQESGGGLNNPPQVANVANLPHNQQIVQIQRMYFQSNRARQ